MLAIDDEWFTPWDEERAADPDEEHSPGHEAYVAWLKETFGLTLPTEAEADEIAARLVPIVKQFLGE